MVVKSVSLMVRIVTPVLRWKVIYGVKVMTEVKVMLLVQVMPNVKEVELILKEIMHGVPLRLMFKVTTVLGQKLELDI